MLDNYKYGFSDDVKPKIQFEKGLTPTIIKQISDLKLSKKILK